MKRTAKCGTMLAAALLFAAAARPASSQEGAGDRAKTAEASSRRRIGVLCPLEGRFATLGESFLRGASIALKEARLKGIANVDLVVGDTRGNPLESRSVAQRLIEEERVDALLGEVLSSSTIAAAQVAELSKTVLFSPVATEEGIGGVGGLGFPDDHLLGGRDRRARRDGLRPARAPARRVPVFRRPRRRAASRASSGTRSSGSEASS